MITYKFPTDKLEQVLKQITVFSIAKDDDWAFRLHNHKTSDELSFVLKGNCTIYQDKKATDVSSGFVRITKAESFHYERKNAPNRLELVSISIKRDIYRDLFTDNLVIDVGSWSSYIANLVQMLIHLAEEKPSGYVTTSNKVLELIVQIVEPIAKAAPQFESSFHLSSMVENVKQYLETNIKKSDITLESLSKKFNTSPFHLDRKFKDETNFSIRQFLINCRIGQAEIELLFYDKDIKTIAYDCGYPNIQQFYAIFKKKTQLSPGGYRKKLRPQE